MQLRSGTVYKLSTPWPTPDDVQPTLFIDLESFSRYYSTLLRKSVHVHETRLLFLEMTESMLLNKCLFVVVVGHHHLVDIAITKLKEKCVTTFNKDEYIQKLSSSLLNFATT